MARALIQTPCEAFSSQGDGTLTIVKENSPTSFVVEQTVQTMTGARTSSLDAKTNRILLIAAEFGPPTPARGAGRTRGSGPVAAQFVHDSGSGENRRVPSLWQRLKALHS